ncbi:superfamily II DNA or RNA helicase [Paenibacillus jamilae]|nr:superfamily II DNA or RNA helicase [Paenibacillus jamilae]
MTTHHDIELYPHNQETYDKVIEAWKTQDRVSTVQATGTGKTFLILKCLFTYPDVNKVVLAPSNHILNQLASRVDELPNTTLLTYTELSFMSEEGIQQLNVSMIVLDEFHRCGAEKWGEGVNKLIAAYPDVKLLGTTATPIRYLDDERDMSDELFDGNVVTNLSLTEAIVKGILPMPKYVSALYTFDEEIMNLKDKIDKSSNSDEEKESLHKEVEQLRKKLDKSKGIPVILKKYLGDSTGKFIVFCRNKKHLIEMQSIVKGWFKKAKLGKGVDLYSVYTGKIESENNKAIEKFVSNKNNNSIRLLFTIDMLNEGLHVEDVDGVICLRPTISPIIYYQQIGRALQIGSKEPFVFDFVNNFNNLGGSTFGNDLREAVEKENEMRRSAEGEIELNLEDFIVYDEIHEGLNLFKNIENQLRNNWSQMFSRYCKGEDSVEIKRWAINQRSLYNANQLTQNKIDQLNSVGFIWNNMLDHTWNFNYELYRSIKEKFSCYNLPNNYVVDGHKIGLWQQIQRRCYKQGKLSQNRIDKLNQINFVWDVVDSRWDKMFQRCAMGDRNEQVRVWEVTQRMNYKNGLLDKHKIKKLKSINFNWNPMDSKWDEMFECYSNGEHSKEVKTWTVLQRVNYKKGILDEDRIDKLNNIGFVWDTKNESWNRNYELYINYIKENGGYTVPKELIINGIRLNHWVKRQRRIFTKGELSQEKTDKLNAIGFQWEPIGTQWDEYYKLLCKYKYENNQTDVPQKYELCGVKLGRWVHHQRQYRKNGKLSQERIDKLDEIGFQWEGIRKNAKDSQVSFKDEKIL